MLDIKSLITLLQPDERFEVRYDNLDKDKVTIEIIISKGKYQEKFHFHREDIKSIQNTDEGFMEHFEWILEQVREAESREKERSYFTNGVYFTDGLYINDENGYRVIKEEMKRRTPTMAKKIVLVTEMSEMPVSCLHCTIMCNLSRSPSKTYFNNRHPNCPLLEVEIPIEELREI